MKKLFILFGFALIIQQNAYSCETGYACSIEELSLKQNESENVLTQIINDFFEKEINDDVFFALLDENTDYKDLFIYKSSISSLL